MMLRSMFLISIALGALAGCGLKGPLYLPEQNGQESAESDEQQRRERSRDSGAQIPAAPTDTSTSTPSAPPPEN